MGTRAPSINALVRILVTSAIIVWCVSLICTYANKYDLTPPPPRLAVCLSVLSMAIVADITVKSSYTLTLIVLCVQVAVAFTNFRY